MANWRRVLYQAALPRRRERPCKNTPGGVHARPGRGSPIRTVKICMWPGRGTLSIARHTKLSRWRRSTRRLLGDRRLSGLRMTRPGVFCDLGRLKLTSECVFLLRAGHLPHHGDDQNAADRWVDPRVQRSRGLAAMPSAAVPHPHTCATSAWSDTIGEVSGATAPPPPSPPSVVTTCVAKHLRLRCWAASQRGPRLERHVFATRVSSLQSQSLY